MAVSKKKRNTHNEKKTSKGTSSLSTKKVKSPKKKPFHIVGIGASAGGLEAFEQFFDNMPPDSGMAFVIVQHLDPARHSSVPDILTRYTKMPIHEATDGMKVEHNSIYLIPPNKSMGIQNGALYLQEPAQPPGLRLPIDFFFRSLAKEKGSDAICIILSGTGTDGTLGLRAIKAELGTVFVQDPETAKYDGMPCSAVNSGLADFVLPSEQMPEQLIKFIHHSAINGTRITAVVEEEKEPLQQIFAIMRTRTGHDFARYKQTTIRRRLERRMSVNQIHDIADYARLLKNNKVEVEALLKDILISVTSFFRDPKAFDALKERLKELVGKKTPDEDLRIWVPGCATGEEAYSLSMIVSECLNELEKHLPVQMYATDIDTNALSIARTGTYPTNIAADVTPERLRRFFVRQDSLYRVKKEIREVVVFAPQNFIKDPPFSRMDIICCRNLLIYLESDVQKRMIPLLHYALKPGGILFLGPSESIGEATDLFTLLDRKWKIYQRREAVISAERLKFPAAFAPSLQERQLTGEPLREVTEARISQSSEKIFLDNYAPTFAVIDEKYRLIYVRGRTGKYLEIASGQPSLSILEMAREGLKTELASAIYRVISDQKKVIQEGIRVKYNGGFQTINLMIAPLAEYGMPPGLLMVVFQEIGEVTTAAKAKPAPRSRKWVAELEEELKLTKGNLQTTIEELEATNEELKSANEELQSNNEELQSTNEELDTSREELQSLNEELTTLNAELQDKNEQLTKANDDLSNFLARTDIAIIFLDSELKIRSFTPASVDVFNLRNIDVGRPLEEITSRLDYENLVDEAREVMRTLRPREKEVQRGDGYWYQMRILPYLTAHNEVSGLVMSFLDIEKQKQAATRLARANEQLEDLARFPHENPSPVLRVDRDGTILYANAACGVLGFSTCEPGQVLPKKYRKIAAEALHSDSPKKIELKGKERIFIMTFSPISSMGYVNVYGNDITERKKAEEALATTNAELNAIYASVPIALLIIDRNRQVRKLNQAAANFSHRESEEMIGLRGGEALRCLHSIDDPEGCGFGPLCKKCKIRQAVMDTFNTGEPQVDIETKFLLNFDGVEEIWLQISTTPLRLNSSDMVLLCAQDITERKKTEEALQQVERDLNRAQAVAETGSWRMDVRKNELTWSDENHHIFGIPKGTPMTYETFLSCVHPNDREYVDQKWQAALQGEDYDIEHRIIVRNEVRWVREKTELEFDKQGMLKGGFGTTQDITARKKAEEALRASENRYRSYIELTGELGWTTNPEGEVTEDLPSFRRFTGQSYEEIKGRGWLKALHPDDLENTVRVWEEAVAGKTSYETEYRLRRYDGIYRYFLARGVPVFGEDSRVREWVGTCIDITMLKEVEQLKDEFIGLVSHELRTPLTIITGSLRSATLPGLSPEDVHELIQNAAEGADSLAVILENMLELSRYQAGHLQLNFELVAINDVARSVVKLLKEQGATQRFTLDFVDNLPLIEADPMRVERILYNLLENATKYSPGKSEIKVSSRNEGDFVVTDVIDRGQGIPRGQQKKLFELFERLETPVKTKGVGLGLAVSKRLVEAQGGWMKVDSKPGKGSTFTFALPIRKAKSQSA